MTHDPRIAVLFRAVACALKAKATRCPDRDQLLLLRDCVLHLRPDDPFIAAVLDFIADLPADPEGAGARLHHAVASASEDHRSFADRAEAALDHTARHPWQERVDICG